MHILSEHFEGCSRSVATLWEVTRLTYTPALLSEPFLWLPEGLGGEPRKQREAGKWVAIWEEGQTFERGETRSLSTLTTVLRRIFWSGDDWIFPVNMFLWECPPIGLPLSLLSSDLFLPLTVSLVLMPSLMANVCKPKSCKPCSFLFLPKRCF